MTKPFRHTIIVLSAAAAVVAGWWFANNMWLLAAYPGWIGSLFLAATILPTWTLFLKQFKARGLVIGFLLVFAGFTIEAMAVKTGWPYGSFVYGGFVEPRLANLPVAVPFLWSALVIGAYQIGALISDRAKYAMSWAVALLVLADVALDPPAVAMGIWHWKDVGVFYGVPLQNFAAWILSGAVGVGLLSREVTVKSIKKASPWLMSGLLWTIAFWVGAALFFQQWWAGFAGVLVVMLILERARNI